MAEQQIYLDNAATTRPHPQVVEAVLRTLTVDYGNPSSLHGMGVAAERVVRAAREAVARSVGVDPQEIVFTSGGTEANALALVGAARARRGRHLITTAVEHSSVLETLRRLAPQGWELEVLPVDRAGRVRAEQVARALRPDTAMVSVMAVNNELGTIQPIPEIAAAVLRHRAAGGRALLHVDAVQAWGTVSLRPAAWGVDLMTLSGHKVHGPKGVGALYVRRGVSLEPLLAGGDQERGLRPGTENVPGIAGMGAAAALLIADREEGAARMRALQTRLRARLQRLPDVRINTPDDGAAPHILSVTVPGVRGETLVHRLEQDGVYISTGSACHSRDPRPSHVLLAIGLPPEEARCTVRISLSRFTTVDEVDAAAEAFARAVEDLRALVS